MRVMLIIPLILMGCSVVDNMRGKQGEENEVARFSSEGSVCGNPAIKGEPAGDIPGSGSCGIENAVSITSVGGIALSQGSLMKCETAQTLNTWVAQSAIPTVGRTGGGLQSLEVAAHYACRTRNHRSGARLSEHAKGNAIDISAFRLADGSEITVLDHWGGGKKGRILKDLHSSACGPFGTVLGPKSDRHHQDHFHFDIADHRNGAYCR